MKKLLIYFFVAVLIFSSFTTVSAKEYDAQLVVTGDFNKDTKILTVHASINNIKPEYGIIVVQYQINYDTSDLALMEANVNMPDLWKPHVESQNAEDLSHRISDGKYSWSIVMAKVKLGIKEDEQLTIDLKFKVKKEADISVRFDNIVVATEIPFKYNGKTMYEPTEISVNDATLEFDSRVSNNDVDVNNNDVSREPVTSQPTKPETPETPETPDVPLTPEVPTVPNGNGSGQSGESTNSQTPSGSTSSESSEPDESTVVDNSNDVSDTSNHVPGEESNSQGEGIVVMPEINNSVDGYENSDEGKDIESNTEADNGDDNTDMTKTIIWIVVSLVAVASIAFAIVLFVRKSKKVDTNA